VIEFVSSEHTAKNVMIRAVRAPSPRREERARREYEELVAAWHVDPSLERLLRA
jgi:hypothetical protein